MTTKEKVIFLIDRGFTAAELARKVDCNKTTIGRWIRGETNLSNKLETQVENVIQNLILELDSIKE